MGANIKVVGIGGAGNNVVNRMVGVVQGVSFVAMNTDLQDLSESKADLKVAIGEKTTKGLGSGGDPSVGQKSAEESYAEIKEFLKDTDLVFITAGMGGGTGTGAAPIVAMCAREMGILTVGVVTKPFDFEGKHRMRNAEIGISNLSKFVDCNIVVPNQKLVEKTKGGTTMLEAFAIADDILRQGVQCITDLIVKNMTINIDFADIASVMRNSGMAHMGIGEASGDNRLLKAIQQAIHSPILETSIKNASQIIMSVMGGVDLSIHEVSNYGSLIKDLLQDDCNIIFGADLNASLNGKVQIIIIATGFDASKNHALHEEHHHHAPKIVEKEIAKDTKKDDDLPPYIRKMRGK
jgi:cell division protein FtsZ